MLAEVVPREERDCSAEQLERGHLRRCYLGQQAEINDTQSIKSQL